MINEGHISVTAKKDYVLLCATDWKTDLALKCKASLPFPELRGRALLSPGGGHPKDRGRWKDRQSGGDNAGREGLLSTDAS